MTAISHMHAREILDSRGNPTIEVDVFLENGIMGRAAVPSGASTGSFEAVEKRDGDKARYLGKGVKAACAAVTDVIQPHLKGMDIELQTEIDQRMLTLDGSDNKATLGANALLAVSLACAKAAAADKNMPLFAYLSHNQAVMLPRPMMNIINGGAHADNSIDIQEFMIMPMSGSSFAENLRMGVEVFHALKSLLKKKGLNTNVGDEGGFAPNLQSATQALDCLCEATLHAGFKLKEDIAFALDAAANEFYSVEKGVYLFENTTKTADEMITYYADLVQQYPILSLEDALAEDDFEAWSRLTQRIGHIQLVGDDIFVTNLKRLQRGIDMKAANAILIKPNQIGTLTETLQTIEMAKAAGFKTIISHRSGETEDTTIADLAVATHAGQIKTGSLSRTDRVCKYNQLLRIEEALASRSILYSPH